MKKVFLICLVISAFSSNLFAQNLAPAAKDFQWIIGKWKRQEGAGKVIEFWQKFDEEMLVRKGYFIVGKDSSELAGASIILGKNCVFQMNVDGTLTNYKLIEFKDKKAVFENNTPLYPKHIEFRKDGTELIVKMEGLQLDEKKKEKKLKVEYRMTIVGR